VKRESPAVYIAWRYYLLLTMILLVVLGLTLRVVDLTVIKQQFLRHQGDVRVLRVVNTPAFRGMITDRNGYPLAVSTAVYSVWINPHDFVNTPQNMAALGEFLDTPVGRIQALLQPHKKKQRSFVYLKRGVAPQIAEKIKRLKLPGVYQQEEYKRYYPEREIAAHLIGFTNIDDQGQEGLELAYEDWLHGLPGKKLTIKDRLGRVISDVRDIQQQKPGNDLVLSMDRRIQYLAYRELMAGVQKNIAASGSVIVLDVRTGEILAMVNLPSFNPNNRAGKRSDDYRNRAITDTFEPGSTIKAFSIASALDSGQFKPNTVINTAPGWMRVGRNLVRDEHCKGLLTVSQILQVSSNVGTAKMILSLPPNQLWSLLHRVGFGEMTGTGFPGEQVGSLVKRTNWKPFTLATMAFGYGISVTPLQLAQAYSIFANDGNKLPVSLLKVAKPPSGQRVMDPKVAKQMLLLLESVVTTKGATGEYARVPGYRVAGKTGTTIIAGPHGYNNATDGRKPQGKKHYVSSFVGIAPVDQPRVVVAVVINDPTGKNYYGGLVSGPVFEKIMEGTLRLLNVPPDDIVSLENKQITKV
jgi:cell division protein FtsI (penicillin-binding protein 3)